MVIMNKETLRCLASIMATKTQRTLKIVRRKCGIKYIRLINHRLYFLGVVVCFPPRETGIISSAAQILLARSIASESKTVYRVFVWQDYKRLYAGGKIDFLKVFLCANTQYECRWMYCAYGSKIVSYHVCVVYCLFAIALLSKEN